MRFSPLLFLPLAFLAAGCSQQTLNSAASDTQKNVKVVQREAKRAERNVQPQLDKAKIGARVTAAITANANLKGTSIRVDAGANGVKLRGSVKTTAQKTLAERVAKDTLGPGKAVENNLKVTGE